MPIAKKPIRKFQVNALGFMKRGYCLDVEAFSSMALNAPTGQRPKSLKAQAGYGIVLLLMFILSSVLLGASMQMIVAPVTTKYLGHALPDSIAAKQLATIGLNAAIADIQTKLNVPTTVDTSYRLPASSTTSVTVPNDPANPGGGSTTLGNYYVTVTTARGYAYMLKAYATVGSSTYTASKLLIMTDTPAVVISTTTCSTLETSIQAGSIASLTNANLLYYAQNNCMLKSGASTLPAAPAAGSGVTACGTHSGSGTLNLATCSANEVASGGTYSLIQMYSTTSISGARTLSAPTTGAMTINVPGAVGAASTFTLGNGGDSLLFGTGINLTGQTNITGGSGDDIVRIEGTYQLATSSIISAQTATISPGNGNNQIYVQALANSNASSNAPNTLSIDASSGTGTNQLYFDSAISNGVTSSAGGAFMNIYGGSGNDIIGCNQTFASSASACVVTAGGGSGSSASQTLTIDGKGGNNIISLNGTITSSGSLPVGVASIKGGSNTGYNIIYISACSGTASNITISPGAAAGSSGNNLIIMGTGNPNACTFSGQTSNDVFMYKTGTPPAGFGRVLTY